MKRIVAGIGIVAVVILGFLLLGNSRSAEGPAQGGGAVVSAAAKGSGKGGERKGPQAVPVVAARPTVRSMHQILDVTGSLKTDDDVQIGTRIAGKVVRVTVKEGQRVQKGQVLVQLDAREATAQLARARATLASNEAKLSQSRNEATWKDTAAQQEYQLRQAALDAARSRRKQAETNAKLMETATRLRVDQGQSGVKVATERLSIVRAATRKQELQEAQLAVEQAKAQRSQAHVDAENARQMLERRQTLYKQDAISKEDVDEADRRYKSMQAQESVAAVAVAVAEQKLDLAKEGSRGEEIRIAEGQLHAAERDLEIAQSEMGKNQVAQDEVRAAISAEEQAAAAVRSAKAGLVQSRMSEDEIRNAQATVAQARADIQYYSTQLADLTIVAPVAGVVSTRHVNEGEMVTPNTPLMNLVALDTVFFEAQVPELEVGLLRSGDPAAVTIDSMPGRKFEGSVREVIPVADRNSKSFRVRVSVSRGRETLPAGAYARAKVDVGTHPNAIVLRKDALHTESGDKFVWLIAPGDEGGTVAKRQLVKVGLVDDRDVEILSGLRPGQDVIAAGSPQIIEGTPVAPALK